MRLIYIHRIFLTAAVALNAALISLYFADIGLPQGLIDQLAALEHLIPKTQRYQSQLEVANPRFVPYMLCIVAVNATFGPLSVLCQIAAMNASETYRRFKVRQFIRAYAKPSPGCRFLQHMDVMVIGTWVFLVAAAYFSLWPHDEEFRKAVHLHHSVFEILRDLVWVFVFVGSGNFLVLFHWSDRAKKRAAGRPEPHDPVQPQADGTQELHKSGSASTH